MYIVAKTKNQHFFLKLVKFDCITPLISAHTIGNPVEYTYCSDIIDHFVISIELADYINKHSQCHLVPHLGSDILLLMAATLLWRKYNYRILKRKHFVD